MALQVGPRIFHTMTKLKNLLVLVTGSALGAGAAFCKTEKIDAVADGRAIFESIGCAECHTVEKGDTSLKSGPNLYGLLLNEPRDREVMVGGKLTKVKADREYFENSIRKSWDALAISETGPTKGEAYQPLMPMYVEQLISNDGVESLWHYLRTLADEGQRGPEKVIVERAKAPEPTDVLKIPGEEIVTKRTRVMRAPLKGTSARALHVGQPNGMSYTFDPRMLSVRRVWTGGYLNLKQERSGRGRNLSEEGKGAKTYFEGMALLAPLTKDGVVVDFEFKEPDAHDYEAIERHLWDGKDFADKLAALDAEFLGHQLDPETGDPNFRFRIGRNTLAERISIDDAGVITVEIAGEIEGEQKFKVGGEGLSEVKVSGGALADGIWTIPGGPEQVYTLTASLAGGVVARQEVSVDENWAPQSLVTRPAKQGKRKLELPAGYTLEDWLPPTDLLGRDQLFEPTGIDVAKDGTILLATRTAGIWRIRDKRWTLFAEGIYEALGVCIEDDKGDVIVIAQKPELTRIRDTNGDGRADIFETLCDDYGFHGNYHEYTHGPARDNEGNYYFLLNLSHDHGAPRVSWRAGGKFMGSMGGYRGWACRVTPEGKFEPFAMGLRSPAGLGFGPDGRLWYAENQGEYVGSSKVVPLEEGKFYGHISGLVSLPGMEPDSPKLANDKWADKLRKGAVWLPHGMVANSPGNPAWDLTQGAFGPFGGQMFIGDQTLSQMLRVVTEQVDGVDQGGVVPFARGLASGLMRPVFLPDGSLVVGQTGRGWGARGGSQAALQRFVYDGKTIPADILDIRAGAAGFVLGFTLPLASDVTEEDFQKTLQAKSWFYTNHAAYGSPRHEERTEEISGVTIAPDRKSVSISLKGFGEGEKWLDRVYHLRIGDGQGVFGDPAAWKVLEGFYTLRAIPQR